MNELTPNLLEALKLLTPRQKKTLTTDQLFELALHGIELTKAERKRLDFNDWNTLYWAGLTPSEEEMKRFAEFKDTIGMTCWLSTCRKFPKSTFLFLRDSGYKHYSSPEIQRRFPSIKLNPR